ncbi:ABC transporter B family member 26, chloroplastic-like isoform X2 [Camellia sinensis]|uniref:ABC transporter B family member 26, chloroplastic-like isoform X2 n=1 Tax=Camellia sinensis TaxID=4442 RepID=UPI001036D36E|nr:ABC transporter B family member 26, chloroplastic-like isoform X2 [Camellia sinensis]
MGYICCIGFSYYCCVQLSEISIPNFLAASVFSAQRGQTAVFYRNSQLLILLCFVSGICSGVRSGCFGTANMILLKRLRETLFAALIFQDLSFFDKEAVGDLTSRLGADCQRLSRVIENDIHMILRSSLRGIGALINLLTLSWPLAFSTLVICSVLSLTSRLGADCQRLSHVIENDIHMILRSSLRGIGALINLLTLSWPLAFSTLVICSVLSTIFLFYGQFQKKVAKFTQEYSASANEAARGTFSLIRTVRVYGTEEEELGRYKQWLDKLVYIGIRESVAYGSWYLSFNTLYRSTQVFAVLLGGMSVLTGHVSAEQLMKYVLYCEWLIYAAWRLEDNLSSLLQAIGASEKVFQLMVLMPSDQFLSKGMKLQRLVGKIEFVNVSFYYPSWSMVPVLEHANISVQTNEMVAIVGLSGSGKSTLVNLLLRLYEPTSGEEPHLFHMDVKSNISYGCSRDIKQQDVEWAAKQANAHEFISSLPNGYETIVDDGLLSGGQKQRIAIARAIVRDPAILILDEATSALDAENEYYIARLLHAFRNDCRVKRTVIVIAHGLSTIKAADKIMVMDGGRVVELGNHVDLLCKGGLYARFVRTKTDDLA